MSQPTQSPRSPSPLTARLYHLEYPRSLGVYSTYQEVQSVVDTLADNQFPVQSTLIVGTDLKLMERVTGRKSWGKVVGQGVLSGLWMGLFLGLLLMLISPGDLMVVATSIVMGIVFFTVWSVIGYAMTGGKRDFTSMMATIPMQYELLVEHKHAEQARGILAESGAGPAPLHSAPHSPVPAGPHSGGFPQQGASPTQGVPAQQGYAAQPGHSGQQGNPGQQTGSFSGSAPQSPHASPASPTSSRPTYGQPASSAAPASSASRDGRPSFGQPAGTPQREDRFTTASPSAGAFGSPALGDGAAQRPRDENAHPDADRGTSEQGSSERDISNRGDSQR